MPVWRASCATRPRASSGWSARDQEGRITPRVPGEKQAARAQPLQPEGRVRVRRLGARGRWRDGGSLSRAREPWARARGERESASQGPLESTPARGRRGRFAEEARRPSARSRARGGVPSRYQLVASGHPRGGALLAVACKREMRRSSVIGSARGGASDCCAWPPRTASGCCCSPPGQRSVSPNTAKAQAASQDALGGDDAPSVHDEDVMHSSHRDADPARRRAHKRGAHGLERLWKRRCRLLTSRRDGATGLRAAVADAQAL